MLCFQLVEKALKNLENNDKSRGLTKKNHNAKPSSYVLTIGVKTQ